MACPHLLESRGSSYNCAKRRISVRTDFFTSTCLSFFFLSLSNNLLPTCADQPECTTCQCPLTVKQILVDCFNFNDTRNKHFVASSMEELFRTTDVQNILDYTKETHFYSKLWCLQTSQCSTLVRNTVVRAILQACGKWWISTPWVAETAEPIEMKLGMVDYVRVSTAHTQNEKCT